MSVDRTAATRSETSTHRRVFSASATSPAVPSPISRVMTPSASNSASEGRSSRPNRARVRYRSSLQKLCRMACMAQRYRSGAKSSRASSLAVARCSRLPMESTSASANLSTSARAVTSLRQEPCASRMEAATGSTRGGEDAGRSRGETSRKKSRQRAAYRFIHRSPASPITRRHDVHVASQRTRVAGSSNEAKTSRRTSSGRADTQEASNPVDIARDGTSGKAAAEGGVPTPPPRRSFSAPHERRRVALLFSRCLFSNPPGNPRGVFSREKAQPARRVRRHKSSGGGVVARHHERR